MFSVTDPGAHVGAVIASQKFLLGLLLYGKGKASFSLASRISDMFSATDPGAFPRRSCTSIRVSHPGRVDDSTIITPTGRLIGAFYQ